MEVNFDNMIPELHYYIHRKCTASWKIDPDYISFIDITYVIAGKARYFIDGTEYVVRKGDLICIPKGTHRAAVSVPEDLMECYTTNFFLRDQEGGDISLPLNLISHIGNVPQLISCFHEIHEEWLKRQFGYKLKVRASMCLILYHVMDLLFNENRITSKDLRIINSIRYMSTHFAEDVSIDTMADLFHIHPVYYGNLFKKAIGMTFKQYLISLRLNHAEDMLKSGESNVGDAALQSGFSDIYYFSKLFKEKKGIPPSKLLPPGRKKNMEAFK